jgi:DHA2 family multidrug resistance protein
MQGFQGQARALLIDRGSDWTTAGRRSLAAIYGMVQQQAALLSFVEVFRIMGFLFLAIIPLVLLMRKARLPGNSPLP